MYLIIDHYDSFVYNLKSYFEALNCEVEVISGDKVEVGYLQKIKNLKGIIFSPGPKQPKDYTNSLAIFRAFCRRIPILGVCLGHQLIAYAFGARIIKGPHPMHGKVTPIDNYQTGLLKGLPSKLLVTRYHSLVVDEASLAYCLQIDAKAQEGAIMAISHYNLPIFGVQFHPEAVLSEYGNEIIGNFIKVCGERRK